MNKTGKSSRQIPGRQSRKANIKWLKERCGDWKCPTVVHKDPKVSAGYKALKCREMDVAVECYLSTAIISLHGEWKNDSSENHFIFVLSTRGGSITNCTVRIVGQNHSHVRTVSIIAGDKIEKDTQAVEYRKIQSWFCQTTLLVVSFFAVFPTLL